MNLTDEVADPETEEAAIARPSPGTPENTTDLFRRLGMTVDLPDVDEEEAESESFVAPASSAPGWVAPEEQEHHEEDHEASVEQYMSELLARMRGEGRGGSQPASHLEPVRRAAAPPSETPAEQNDTLSPPKPVRRTVAVEKADAREAMRELAKMAARSAIDIYTIRHLRRTFATRMAITGLALMIILVLLLAADWDRSATIYGLGLASVVAVVWSALSVVSMLRLIRCDRQDLSLVESKTVDQADLDDEPPVTANDTEDVAGAMVAAETDDAHEGEPKISEFDETGKVDPDSSL